MNEDRCLVHKLNNSPFFQQMSLTFRLKFKALIKKALHLRLSFTIKLIFIFSNCKFLPCVIVNFWNFFCYDFRSTSLASLQWVHFLLIFFPCSVLLAVLTDDDGDGNNNGWQHAGCRAKRFMCIISLEIPIAPLWGRNCYYPYFTVEESRNIKKLSQKSHSCKVTESEFKLENFNNFSMLSLSFFLFHHTGFGNIILLNF